VWLVAWLVTLRFGSFSLFKLLYVGVPGAAAIRVGYRIMLVVDLFAVVAVALAVRHWLASHRGLPARGAVAALLAFLVVEQANAGSHSFVSASAERRWLAEVPAPPAACRHFFIAHQPGAPVHVVQIDAMLVAHKVRLPTLNGYSGRFPSSWPLWQTDRADYEATVGAWARARNLAAGLCRYDATAKRWSAFAID
jgi:hypothetical protein